MAKARKQARGATAAAPDPQQERRRKRVAKLMKAGSQYAEIWAVWQQSARKWRLLAVMFFVSTIFFAWGWHGAATTYPEPMVIRVDEVGRAIPVQIAQMGFSYSAVDPVTRYFLTQFILDNLERDPQTVAQRWQRSLHFLHQNLLNHEKAQRIGEIGEWVSGHRQGAVRLEELDLLVQEQRTPPYKARATCRRIVEAGEQAQVEPLVIEIEFVFVGPAGIPQGAVLTNPVGLVLTRFDVSYDLGF